ncbi:MULTISPECIES: phosphoribosyltransferase family protein [unclassified Siphonobacter]|uniref:phosphoribosyltransferase family protein n=1 Tax=unclassified Siphonobacter TaxID=2635712 RepID=UPI00277EEEA5|nr:MULTISPECIES: phosphoribosyltransferase family protein [unclassified Siphonobacter]MDQ1085881.1 pyrimidine operon attenuation protein/uracil phosphoribosyltransferase [Siphonobacter sp. SORGH_AS_1065]MDR6196204.1 pyrimidine operon attenuation protein/uracil phosphoribosyltransferase [Siphonobacter sp. SORGH_AS_0500]
MISTEKTLLLNPEQLKQKIRRIAFEVYETNFEEKEIVLAGIVGQGVIMASLLKEQLEAISPLKVQQIDIQIQKTDPSPSSIKLNTDSEMLMGKCVIVCDDVLYTGRTLAYSLLPFFQTKVKRLQVSVLVDRNYRRYPVSADFVGYALMTTLNDHIDVILEGPEMGVYLQ